MMPVAGSTEKVTIFLGRVVRDVLDVDAALGRDDEGDARGLAVDQDREIELLVDVRAVLDVEAVDLLAGAGLDRDERRAEHLLGEFGDLGGDLAMRTPPLSPAEASLNLPLPRPPAWIWLFTTQIGPGSCLGGGVRVARP